MKLIVTICLSFILSLALAQFNLPPTVSFINAGNGTVQVQNSGDPVAAGYGKVFYLNGTMSIASPTKLHASFMARGIISQSIDVYVFLSSIQREPAAQVLSVDYKSQECKLTEMGPNGDYQLQINQWKDNGNQGGSRLWTQDSELDFGTGRAKLTASVNLDVNNPNRLIQWQTVVKYDAATKTTVTFTPTMQSSAPPSSSQLDTPSFCQ